MIRKIILVCCIVLCDYAQAKQTLQTVWGNFEIDDPIIEELIQSKAMQRLKEIDQSGPPPYLGLMPYFSRYDHSVGVFVLLNKAEVSRIEQIAGLLHDTSHTVFSHLGDNLFYKAEQEKSYQDNIHLWFLKEIGIEKIIEKYNISMDQLDPDNPQYTALEQPLPLLCADRIQYNIHTGVMFNYISQDEAKQIIENLQFIDNKWFFTDPKLAKKFATISVNLTSQFWGSEWNAVIYDCFCEILKHAMEIGIVTKDELHFGYDKQVFKKLQASKEPKLQELLKTYNKRINNFYLVDFGKGQINTKPKFRGIDPLVYYKGNYQTLSKIDAEFNHHFNLVKKWCEKGYGINYYDFNNDL